VHETAEAFAVRTPAQIRARVDDARAVGLKLFRQSERGEADDGLERHFVDRQRRLTGRPPDALVRIGEYGPDDLGESRAGVVAILIGRLRLSFDVEGHGANIRRPFLRARPASFMSSRVQGFRGSGSGVQGFGFRGSKVQD
jgi:hypothetical protein